MARIRCTISYGSVENADGREVDGVVAICSKCRHEAQSYGTSDASIKFCLARMRKQCPRRENNRYVTT